jgi:peroxiredoxin
MNKQTIITILFALVAVVGQAQEECTDTVIPKFLSNGYFFREMPQLPDGEKTMSRLKDKEGNSVIVINVNATLPKSVIRKAIPREQVHNADQFLSGLNMMATVTSLTQAGVKADGTWYSPKEGEPFPQFSERDMDGRTWTNDSVKGRVMVINLWYSGCGHCRAEMPTVVKAYTDYHAKGLEVVGVSLDNDKDAWLKAITQLKMPWPQMSDLKGWECEGAALYNVRSIPANVLIDQQGRIIAKDLRGVDLLNKMDELLK